MKCFIDIKCISLSNNLVCTCKKLMLSQYLQRSGITPGVGMVHAPLALLPMPFPEDYWRQACELAPIFNELVDRVSLDGKFLQDCLSRFLLTPFAIAFLKLD